MQQVALLKKIKESPSVYTYYFEKPEGFSWTPGTHVHLAFPAFKDSQGNIHREFVRHFSIMNLDSEPYIAISTRIGAEGSLYKRSMMSLELGEKMILFKPVNDLPLLRAEKNVVLLSMGGGAATVKPYIEAFLEDPTGIASMRHLTISKKGETLYKTLADRSASKVLWQYFHQREAYLEAIKALATAETHFYVVGSDAFLEGMVMALKVFNIKADQIFLDKREDGRKQIIGE